MIRLRSSRGRVAFALLLVSCSDGGGVGEVDYLEAGAGGFDAGASSVESAPNDARDSSGPTRVDDASTPEAGSGPLDARADDVARDGALVVDASADAAVARGCTPGAGAATKSKSFSVRESVEQLHITHAMPGTTLELVGCDGKTLASGVTDTQGSLILRSLPPGTGYTLRLKATPSDLTDQLRVYGVAESLPPESFYAGQVLKPGFGYLTTRDGTKLSVFVSLPGPPEDGPYPTVVNYSGYEPSQPGGTLEGFGAALCVLYPVLCNSPHDQSALIANLMGYASVGVNMRGTACSGGAYDYFEPLQILDGYDAIEVVAHQSWVKHGKVGMTGLSYPGISQLFVAQSQPPHLAAITPMSVIADTATSTLAPGGIFNDGFAFRWAQMVMDGAKPYGKGWEKDVVATEKMGGGTSTCEENQLLHSQYVDAIEKAKANKFYSDAVKPLDPTSFVHKINVPVFLTGQWQDEQTGPHFAALLDKFTGAPITRFTMTNGVHPDGFSPQVLVEWKTFLDLYVAKVPPRMDGILRLIAPEFFAQVFKEPLQVPATRFENVQRYEDALASYQREPKVRVIFESGADPSLQSPGAPKGRFELPFSAWPIPDVEATRFYFQPGGALARTEPPAQGGYAWFNHEPAAGQRTTLAAEVTSSDEVWLPQPRYAYRPLAADNAVAFVSEPLTSNTVMVGHGSVDLWLQSSASDADLEVNLTEVRADGKESHVQSGWLRASQRKLRADATSLRPVHTHLEADAAPLPAGAWELVRVELMPFGHVFRSGSRIRVSVDTPGDSRAAWKFILLESPTPPAQHRVATHQAHASSIVLPVLPRATVPAAGATPPACESLRGQPCRSYVPFTNRTQ